MGRATLPMKLITCERLRNRVFQNRRKGLSKKCSELSLLCGIDVCMISLGPPGKRRFQPETYPKDKDEVKRIIQEYRRHKGKDNGKNHYTVASMLRVKATKLKEELGQQVVDNDGSASKPPLDDKLLEGMSEESLREMAANLDAKLASVRKELELHNAAAGNIVEGLVAKMEPAVEPQWSIAMVQEEMGWNQMVNPCMSTMNPNYGGSDLCDDMVMELHQEVQPVLSSVSYEFCNEDPLAVLPPQAGMAPPSGFNSFQEACSFLANVSFDFPNCGGF